jgi:hypothetical protein
MKNVRPFISKQSPGKCVRQGRYSRSVALCAIAFGLLLSGCASYPIQRLTDASLQPAAVSSQPLQFAATTTWRASSESRLGLQLRRRERALLVPSRAPDCTFVESNQPDPVDADRWERIKLDYERSCYRRAEAAARDRLRQLQTVVRRKENSLVQSTPRGDVVRRDDAFRERELDVPYVYGSIDRDGEGRPSAPTFRPEPSSLNLNR